MHIPHFIVVSDRGVFRAGWIESLAVSQGQHRTKIRWIEELAFVSPREHLVEQVTDMSGAFAPTNSTGSTLRHMQSSPAEVHWKIAADHRAVEALREAIIAVLFREKPETWSLAAPADIHLALRDSLPEVCRDRLVRVLPKNLASASSRSIVEHFCVDTVKHN
jgi:hypothetical protein